jgi:hypothetical protein
MVWRGGGYRPVGRQEVRWTWPLSLKSDWSPCRMALVEIILTVTARKRAARHNSALMAAQVSVDWGPQRWDFLSEFSDGAIITAIQSLRNQLRSGVAQPAAAPVRILQPRNNRPALRVPESRVETRVSLRASSGKAGRLQASRFYAFVAFADGYGAVFDLPSVD